jgi:hydrogenase maturation protease
MRATNAKTLLPPAPGLRDVRGSPPCRKMRDKGGAPDVCAEPAVLLACGNPLRQDDGVGLRIAEAAEQHFPVSRLRVVAVQQWTPELAEEIAGTELAIFVDASVVDEPGAIRVRPVGSPTSAKDGQMWGTQGIEAPIAETHGVEPEKLLAMAERVCGHAPARAFVLTVGAARMGYGEQLSGPLRRAVPRAVRLVENLVAAFAPEVRAQAVA